MKIFSLLKCAGALLVTVTTCAASFGQTCYLTSVVDNSRRTTTTVNYDGNNNIVSVAIAMGSTTMTYTASTEKTATGYKKMFTMKDDNSPAMSFVLTNTTLTYNNANRLVLMEGSNNHGIKGTEKYVYNASNQLVQIDQDNTYTDPSGKVSADKGQIAFTYPNATSKNPSEIKVLGIVNNQPGLKLIEHYILTYGDGKAISDEFPFSSGPFRTFAANNVATADITYVGAQMNVKQTYTYTFNENKYPTSKTYQFSGDPTTDTYSYSCK